MTLDTLDAAFVQRWRAAVPTSAPATRHDPPPAAIPRAAPTLRAAPAVVAHAPAPVAAAVPTPEPASPPVRPTAPNALVERLLAEAAAQWDAIADRIEAARGRGRRVIAVAGCDRGEGRTTLVAAVAAVLRSRGREVTVVEPGDLPGDAGPTHGKQIVLVDAGVWFPAGPIRRGRLVVASHGCEAAIVVRRAGRPTTTAIEAALEPLGIELLGEVVTFVEPASTDSLEAVT